MVLQIIFIKFSCILKTMSRNTFPDPQPDSASYGGEGNSLFLTTSLGLRQWGMEKPKSR